MFSCKLASKTSFEAPHWLNLGAYLEYFGEALELFFVFFEVLFLKLFLETLLNIFLAKMWGKPTF